MKFKVVVCSKCKRARGVRTDSKKVKCNKCGATIGVKQAKAYFTTDSPKELARRVAEQNAKPLGKGLKVTPRDISEKKGDEETLIECLAENGDLTLEQAIGLIAENRDVRKDEVSEGEVLRILDVLKQKGLIFEQRDGYFKKV